MTTTPGFAAFCVCGRVAVEATDDPIVTAVCYCDDCQEGARRIEALPNAAAILEPGGGTLYLLFRKDRFRCTKGDTLLKNYKLKETSATNRVVATCCNSAMFVNFDKGPHWVSAYRARFDGDLPPVEMRIWTKFRLGDADLPGDAPNYPRFSLRLIARLVTSRAAMLLGR
jgi:hypothetical protein